MAISAADLNALYETYLGRPADTAGIQGYQSSGKSIDEIAADLAWVAATSPEQSLSANAQYYEAPSESQLGLIQSLGGGTPTFQNPDTFQAPADSPGMLRTQQQVAQTGGTSTGPVDAINNTTVNKLADQLKAQYDALNQNAGYTYGGKQSDLDKMFRAQAAKLAVNGINDLSDVGEADGKLINKVTGDVIKKVNLKGESWQNDGSTAFEFKEDIQLEDRGSFQRWGKDLSVDGQADYGINFVDGQAVMVPIWKDTATDVGPLATIAAVGLSLAFPGAGAAIGSTLAPTASAAVQAAVGSAALAGVSTGVITGDMDKALIAAALAGGGSYLNASGTLGEAFDSLGLGDFKDTVGIQGGVPTAGGGATGMLAEDAAFIAADAAQLAQQGLSPEQISQTLLSTGANPDIARLAANLATTGSDATSIANTLSGMGGGVSGGLFSATPADLAAAGITTGGTSVPALTSAQIAQLASGTVAGNTLTEQLANLGITGGGAATAGGLLNNAAKTAATQTLAEQARGLLTNVAGAGIDYAALQQIGKEATALGREAEARATAAGAAANVPFTPYTVTSGAGSTAFGVDPVTGRPTATVTAAQPYADLRTQALTTAGTTLGAINPAAAAESLFQRSEALAAPARERETEQLLSTLGARGLLGVSRNLPTVGGTTAGVNPYLESLLSAQRSAQAQTALQAQQFGTQEAQRQAALAQGLISTGQGIDTAAMGTLTQGANLGSLATAADQTSAGRLLEATLAGQRLRLPYETIGLDARQRGILGIRDVAKGGVASALDSELAKSLFSEIFK